MAPRRRRRLAVAIVIAFALSAIATVAGPPRPAAAAGTGYFLTLVARQCPDYPDITGNRARNNIMESLRDLGADTLYAAGEPISVAKEDAGQPNCSPITGWKFTLGSSISGQVSGSFGKLSVVGGADGTALTQASVPELSPAGADTGRTIAGAVTIQLSSAQLARAQSGQNLWVQGGSPSDPINQTAFPDLYGFGSLRCAIDNLNGDNVEWVGYPQSYKHVLCYAYYVTPPPTSGTIKIIKKVPAGDTSTETFHFGGTVSFNPGGTFDLTVNKGASASMTFVRAETGSTDPWVVTETGTADWRPSGPPTCTTVSGSVTSVSGQTVTIHLKAGDTVTCTYSDEPIPPTSLTLRKLTYGGVGAFDFLIEPSARAAVSQTITTTEEGVAVSGPPTALTAGPYDITETSPATPGGTWKLSAVQCDGTDLPTSQPIHVVVPIGEQPVCTFVNTFDPAGSITIQKVSHGATGRMIFQTTKRTDPTFNAIQVGHTVEVGVPVTAIGQSLKDLNLGTYDIDELAPEGPAGGTWTLASVRCDGVLLRSTVLGSVAVTLTTANPHQTCVFTDQFTPDAGPSPSGGVLPTDGNATPPATSSLASSPAREFDGGWLLGLLGATTFSLVILARRRPRRPPTR
jgi:hypothetical protein